MSNEVNDVINNICEKLGTTVDIVVPEFAKYMIVSGIKNLIIGLILLILDIVIFKLFLKWVKHSIAEYKKKYDDDHWIDDDNAGVIFGACIILVALSISSFAAIVVGLDFIDWIISPKGAFVDYVLHFKSR